MLVDSGFILTGSAIAFPFVFASYVCAILHHRSWYYFLVAMWIIVSTIWISLTTAAVYSIPGVCLKYRPGVEGNVATPSRSIVLLSSHAFSQYLLYRFVYS